MATQVIILAGGIGRRMGGVMPKALIPLHGRPIIAHLLEQVKQSNVTPRPVIVIGKSGHLVRAALGEKYDYVEQPEQLGTGHAVMMCKGKIHERYTSIMVLYGDHPLLPFTIIQQLASTHETSGATLSLMTVQVPDFTGWHKTFYSYGRIIRNQSGDIERIREFKDCTDAEKRMTEVNPSFFCFRADWLWNNIEKLKNENAQKEYYLTDLVAMALQAREKITALAVEPKQAFGINTPEELAMAEGLVGE